MDRLNMRLLKITLISVTYPDLGRFYDDSVRGFARARIISCPGIQLLIICYK